MNIMTRARAALLARRYTADADRAAHSPDRLGAAITASQARLAVDAARPLGVTNADIRPPYINIRTTC